MIWQIVLDWSEAEPWEFQDKSSDCSRDSIEAQDRNRRLWREQANCRMADVVGWSSHNLGFRIVPTILSAIRELDSIQFMLVNGL